MEWKSNINTLEESVLTIKAENSWKKLFEVYKERWVSSIAFWMDLNIIFDLIVEWLHQKSNKVVSNYYKILYETEQLERNYQKKLSSLFLKMLILA